MLGCVSMCLGSLRKEIAANTIITFQKADAFSLPL